MIKKHPLFGSGYRGFRKECDKYYYIESKSKDVRCTTHPHNSFLELLSETGTVGVIIFFIFLYRLILDSFKDSGYKNKKILFLCLLLAIFNPIKPTGSFFSSWYGSIFWFILGFFIIENKLNKYKSEK
jgi:O-antigen ligase